MRMHSFCEKIDFVLEAKGKIKRFHSQYEEDLSECFLGPLGAPV